MVDDSRFHEEGVDPNDVVKILIATDIHLGYEEKNLITGDDTFNTFEEILKIGADKKVDMILLGGDLFHESKPSPSCLHRCTVLLKKYCMGDDPVSMEFISDQSVNFSHCSNPIVNYEDPNLNISIPVFSIHGNHDDPSGMHHLSALDLLSDVGLVNYFGKVTDLTNVEVFPLLLQKGHTKLALYGLSHIKDERLSRLFLDNRVTMMRPTEGDDDWFSLLTLHQNRVERGATKNFIPEEVLPDFFDFIVWGHEHDCNIDPVPVKNYYICQPGSSVATSLSEGESQQKHVGILHVNKKRFRMEKIRLNTVRPFMWSSKSLHNEKFDRASDKPIHLQAQQIVAEAVEEMIEESRSLLTGHPKQPKLPLIRIRVEYQEEDQIFNTVRAGQMFESKVANPTNLILLRKGVPDSFKRRKESLIDGEALQIQSLQDRVETMVEDYFDSVIPEKQLEVLSARGLCQAVISCVDKGDYEAIDLIIDHQIKKTVDALMATEFDIENIDNEVKKIREERLQTDEKSEATSIIDNPTRVIKAKRDPEPDSLSSDDSDAPLVPPSSSRPARGRGSRGPRGPRGSRGGTPKAGRSPAPAPPPVIRDSPPREQPTRRSSRRGRPSAAATRARQTDLSYNMLATKDEIFELSD